MRNITAALILLITSGCANTPQLPAGSFSGSANLGAPSLLDQESLKRALATAQGDPVLTGDLPIRVAALRARAAGLSRPVISVRDRRRLEAAADAQR